MRKWLTNRLASLVALLERPRDEADEVSPLTQRIKEVEDERNKLSAYVLLLEDELGRANKAVYGARRNEGLLAARIGRLQTENPEVHQMYFTVNHPPRGR